MPGCYVESALISDLLQERVRFSLDFQGGLHAGQLLLGGRQQFLQSDDCHLFFAQLAIPSRCVAATAGGVIPVEDSRVAQLAPTEEPRGIQPVGAQIASIFTRLGLVLVTVQEVGLLGRDDGPGGAGWNPWFHSPSRCWRKGELRRCSWWGSLLSSTLLGRVFYYESLVSFSADREVRTTKSRSSHHPFWSPETSSGARKHRNTCI